MYSYSYSSTVFTVFTVLSCLLFDSCIAQGYFPTAGPILAPQKNLFPSPIPYARVPIIKYVNEPGFDGNYRYSYEAGNGIVVQEQGTIKNQAQRDLESSSVVGSFSYTSPEGVPITLNYVADENGFHAEGAHLPTPPPIPEAIAKSLAYNAQFEHKSFPVPIGPNPAPVPHQYYQQKRK